MARTPKRETKYVRGYEGEPMRPKMRLKTEEYEYELPFNYANVKVDRSHYHGGEFHGIEMLTINGLEGTEGYVPSPADGIVIEEEHPIIRVAVIGSACTPPGYIQIDCEPIKNWRRPNEIESVMPVRMRINGLWGMHLRFDQWYAKTPSVQSCSIPGPYERIPEAFLKSYPEVRAGGLKMNYGEFPLAGMSCAIFELPPCRKVTVMAGSETPGWRSDYHPADAHYSVRIIRTTVQLNRKERLKGAR